MGTAAYGGKGFKGTAAVSDEGPIGAASCRQQHNQVSCQSPPPPPLLILSGNYQYLAARTCMHCEKFFSTSMGIAWNWCMMLKQWCMQQASACAEACTCPWCSRPPAPRPPRPKPEKQQSVCFSIVQFIQLFSSHPPKNE